MKTVQISLDTVTALEKVWYDECPDLPAEPIGFPLAHLFVEWAATKGVRVFNEKQGFYLQSGKPENITSLLLRC